MNFSIVTVSYNQGQFLEQAIRSVLEQSYGNIEYIVVDPGSTDGSHEIIEKYRDRLAAVIFDPDRGPADGLNKGFARGTGAIFGYLNADDFFEHDAFSHVARHFDTNSETDVLCGAIRIIRHNGTARRRLMIPDRFDLKKVVAGACVVGQQGTFFRQRAFARTRGFNVENRTCWDAELLVDLALAGCRFELMHKVLGNFRLHRESISGSGRLDSEYHKDLERIRSRLAGANIRIHPVRGAAMRIARKANILRHLRSIAVT